MKRIQASIFLFLAVTAAVTAIAATPMTVETLLKLHRLGDPQVSPDGKTVVYSVMSPNLEANSRPASIWTVPADGGTPRKLVDGSRPRWSPDGKRIAYIGGGQIWIMAADGSGAKEVTRISTGADGETWS